MKFGSWTPDLPEFGHDGLVKARNAYSGILGYEPIKALSQVTAALARRGRAAGRLPGGGTTILLAGPMAGSTGSPRAHRRWLLRAPTPQAGSSLSSATRLFASTAAHRSNTRSRPGLGRHWAAVRRPVPIRNRPRLRVPRRQQHEPEPGLLVGNQQRRRMDGRHNQCDVQDLPDGGAITGLSGGEFGLAFQDDAIHIFEYVGTPTIFTRRKVSSSIGALCHGSIAQHGRQTFFYSRRGFYKFVDGEVVPIGRNKVDRTFRTTYSVGEIQSNLRCSIDPERSLVIWSMPDRLWVYNFENDMWSDVFVTGIVGISTGRTASLTLEDIAVIYPSIENVTPTLDDPFWSGGSSLAADRQDGRQALFVRRVGQS
jgi:hypothetical protein